MSETRDKLDSILGFFLFEHIGRWVLTDQTMRGGRTPDPAYSASFQPPISYGAYRGSPAWNRERLGASGGDDPIVSMLCLWLRRRDRGYDFVSCSSLHLNARCKIELAQEAQITNHNHQCRYSDISKH